MVSGDTATATAALDPLEVNATRNPLLYLDRLAALSYAGKREQVIRQILSSTLPYQSLPLPARMIIDSATLTYLERGRPNDWVSARVSADRPISMPIICCGNKPASQTISLAQLSTVRR